MSGGLFHGLQLWVNLPAKDKMTAPRYQSLEGEQVAMLSSPDGGALVRIVAGDVDGHTGPGSTHTPIAFVHATVAPGARLELPWRPDFNALVYVMTGHGSATAQGTPLGAGQLAVFGPGDYLRLAADPSGEPLELIVLGGQPIRESVAQYGPFVMNTRAELAQAVDDFRSGRLGVIPANALMPHRFDT
jgi:redox-sensitive bicupin YhaK (pirin superfamily)